jgi:NosR/NirI family transcriptional regulator, nitrous oxide reductase regulator
LKMNYKHSESCLQGPPTWYERVKRIIKLCAILSLIAAYVVGLSLRGKDDLVTLEASFPENTELKKLSNNPLLYEVFTTAGSFGRFVAVEKHHGYGGPVTLATEVDAEGTIQNIVVIDHKETPAFFQKIQEQHFFDQFIGKQITASLTLGNDIDSVSGATVSATAFSKSIQSGSHQIAKKVLRMEVTEAPVSWQFGFKEIIILLLYAMVFLGVWTKSRRIRYVTLFASVIFLGFYFNAAISISNISTLFLGYLPRFFEKISWWLLVVGAFLMIFTFGKNLWCQWLCPFGAIQEFTAKISGVDLRPSAMTLKIARTIPYILTWASLIIIFLTSNPALGSYEPFATLFGLEGIAVQWYILPTVILGSFFLNRFWCRFFCPVGLVFRITTKLRSKAKRIIKGTKS